MLPHLLKIVWILTMLIIHKYTYRINFGFVLLTNTIQYNEGTQNEKSLNRYNNTIIKFSSVYKILLSYNSKHFALIFLCVWEHENMNILIGILKKYVRIDDEDLIYQINRRTLKKNSHLNLFKFAAKKKYHSSLNPSPQDSKKELNTGNFFLHDRNRKREEIKFAEIVVFLCTCRRCS